MHNYRVGKRLECLKNECIAELLHGIKAFCRPLWQETQGTSTVHTAAGHATDFSYVSICYNKLVVLRAYMMSGQLNNLHAIIIIITSVCPPAVCYILCRWWDYTPCPPTIGISLCYQGRHSANETRTDRRWKTHRCRHTVYKPKSSRRQEWRGFLLPICC